MTRLVKIIALLFITSSATAFSPSKTPSVNIVPRLATEDTDFDAPIPINPQTAHFILEDAPVVDDECYMGKDDSFDECVDFDPPRRTRSMNAMDRVRAPPKWAFGDDFDAPVLASPQSGTTVMTEAPVLDDECYMGKDGSAGECVDFDPPKRANLWTNSQDKPRGPPKGLTKLL
ncbi:hypothetical protein HJC23_013630 [Cyclotella cryptica]|uniref:Uncharacterized protein n=1 Tax=Cyclotella cryptica TaxID=29204 RepID=A0ABD3PA14_9STRA|eukprot:CCRYP_016507-RA/>CCRYP_016507-RA protein AED:0.00 eAED:0.00 QI:295/-1/1/1/-1/1/1/278/173